MWLYKTTLKNYKAVLAKPKLLYFIHYVLVKLLIPINYGIEIRKGHAKNISNVNVLNTVPLDSYRLATKQMNKTK